MTVHCFYYRSQYVSSRTEKGVSTEAHNGIIG